MTPNLMWRLQSTSGFGVRPLRCSSRKSANTCSRYSFAKFTRCRRRPSVWHTRRASWKSRALSQYPSSSQLLMCRHWTSCPASRSNSAATAESTPPESATIVRFDPGMGAILPRRFARAGGDLLRGALRGFGPAQITHEVERVSDACHVVVDAAADGRAAQIVLAGQDLGGRQPVHRHDTGIELDGSGWRRESAGERE